METKDTLPLCSDLDEQEIQQLQLQAKNLKEISMNKFTALKTTTQRLEIQKVLKSSSYDSDAREARQDFKDYTQMEAQSFKDLIIQHMESIEQCIVKRACHEQEIHNRLKRLNEKKLQIQECMVQKVKATDASLGEKDCGMIVSDTRNDQNLENQSNTSGMKAAGQGMKTMTKALLGMIRILDLPMTQNQWL
ncbi:hypothetical protein Tco_0026762, partial [Tanacetum coccineum]